MRENTWEVTEAQTQISPYWSWKFHFLRLVKIYDEAIIGSVLISDEW
ncbi:hypothetical protein [Commensalibacter melissae]|nr:hypothetical protein [Commensalibacter melissae]MUH07175.1 hypothetical protein [Commensalibacter melissae]